MSLKIRGCVVGRDDVLRGWSLVLVPNEPLVPRVALKSGPLKRMRTVGVLTGVSPGGGRVSLAEVELPRAPGGPFLTATGRDTNECLAARG